MATALMYSLAFGSVPLYAAQVRGIANASYNTYDPAQMILRAGGGPYSTSLEFDGRVLTFTHSDSQTSTTTRAKANLSDIDLGSTRVHSEKGLDPGFYWYSLYLQCKPGLDCWDFGTSRSNHLIYADCPTDRNSCQDFLERLRSAAGAERTPSQGQGPSASFTQRQGAPSQARTIDCQALRSIYYADRQRHALPPECLTDLDRDTTYQHLRRRVPGSRIPVPEPVIDGSTIPSQIDFTPQNRKSSESVGPATTPAPADGGNTARRGVPSPASPPSSTVANNTPRNETSPVTRFGSLFEGTASTNKAEEVGAGIFDQIAKRSVDGSGRFSVTKYVVKEVLQDWVKSWDRNRISQIGFGRPWNELPEAFRADAEVWDAGVRRLVEPFSVKGGVTLVNAFGNLLDLWNK